MKYILFVLAFFLCGLQSACAQYYSIIPTPLCWNPSSGVDSSIIAVRFYIAGNSGTVPVGSTGYWDLYGNAVTIGSGTVSSGFCSGDTMTVAPVLPPDCMVTRDINHFNLTSGTTNFAANTYYGITISVISGTADVTVNGTTFSYPAGYNGRFNSPHQCEYLNDAVEITITSGRAIVLTLQ